MNEVSGLPVNSLALLDGEFAGEDQFAERLTSDIIAEIEAHGIPESFGRTVETQARSADDNIGPTKHSIKH